MVFVDYFYIKISCKLYYFIVKSIGEVIKGGIMAVKTANSYGKITISDQAIETIAGSTAMECYGVVDLVAKRFSDNFALLFKKQQLKKGVKVLTVDNKIYIDLYVILKYSVSISAVAESLKSSVKYSVEKFTGMIVDSVNVNVCGIRV